jgi:hypothetical protein
MVGISYDPKIDQFLARIGMEPGGRTDALDHRNVADLALQLIDERESWQQSVDPALASLKKQAHDPAKRIVSVFSNQHTASP